MFELAQPASGPRTLLARSATDPDAVVWNLDLADPAGGLFGSGPALMAAAEPGERLAVAEFNPGAGLVRLQVFASDSGAQVFERLIPAASLRGLQLSEAGDRLLLQVASDLLILDGSGQTIHLEQLAFTPSAAAISGDGRQVAFGTFGEIRRLADDGSGYTSQPSVTGPADHLPTALALADDGSRLASGWWRFTDARAVELCAYDLSQSPVVTASLGSQSAPGAALQNFVEACAFDASGRYAAFGLWGTGDGAPEVLVYDVDAGSELLSEDLPGSVQALDFSGDGTRLAIGAKDVHANQLGSLGTVHLFSTGLADQVLENSLRPGVPSAHRFSSPGSSAALCLVGTAGALSPLPGIDGDLHLDLNSPLVAVPMVPDGPGEFRIDLQVQVGWIGIEVALQGVGLGPGGIELANTRVEPRVL